MINRDELLKKVFPDNPDKFDKLLEAGNSDISPRRRAGTKRTKRTNAPKLWVWDNYDNSYIQYIHDHFVQNGQ